MSLRTAEKGSVSGFVVVLTMSFVAMVGLVYDGARVMAAYVRASDTAENAARIGGQYISGIRSGHPEVDPVMSEAAMRHFLQQNHADASVWATDDNVAVTVTAHVRLQLLDLFGIPTKVVRVTRSVVPVIG